MAALIIIAGVGVFCWLLYNAAIYALPLFVGLSIGFHAEQAGAGTLGALVLGVGTAALVVVVARVIFTLARSPILRIVFASIFALPAALAGYFTTSTLFGLASASDGWRQLFAILGAMAVGATAWRRLAAMVPPAAADLRPRPEWRWRPGGWHQALDTRRRPLRRSF